MFSDLDQQELERAIRAVLKDQRQTDSDQNEESGDDDMKRHLGTDDIENCEDNISVDCAVDDLDPFAELKCKPDFETLLADFGEDVALACLITCKNQGLENLIDWCLDKCNDDVAIDLILKTHRHNHQMNNYHQMNNFVRKEQDDLAVDVPLSEANTSVDEAERDDPMPEATPAVLDLLGEQLNDIWCKFLKNVEGVEASEYLRYKSLYCLRPKAKRPWNYLSCSWIFCLIYALSTSSTVLLLFFVSLFYFSLLFLYVIIINLAVSQSLPTYVYLPTFLIFNSIVTPPMLKFLCAIES